VIVSGKNIDPYLIHGKKIKILHDVIFSTSSLCLGYIKMPFIELSSQTPANVCHWNVNKNPTDPTVCRYLFTAKLLSMFRVSQHPSSGVLKTVTAASGTSHNTGTATSLQRGLIGTGLCESHATRTNQSRSGREVAVPVL